MIGQQTRRIVRLRAGDRCEYCRLPQEHSPVARLQIEYVIPLKHGGGDETSNLALACIDCNLAKSSNLSGIDVQTGQIVELFNPRLQIWHEHFAWSNSTLVGQTACGRATVAVLNANDARRIQVRIATGYE